MGRRAQIRMSDDEVQAFLAEERTVICATNGPRGWPHLMPLWYVLRPTRDGGAPEIWAWTFSKSQKAVNIGRDARATLQVEAGDSYDALRGVMFECDVVVHDAVEDVRDFGLELYARYAPSTTTCGRWSTRRRRSASRCSSSSASGRRGITASWAASTEGAHPLRRARRAPAADHPHERQAARAGRQPAGALLRHRGDGGGGHRGRRGDHRAGDRRGGPRPGRRGRPLRGAVAVLRQEGPGRPRPRRADGRAVPR